MSFVRSTIGNRFVDGLISSESRQGSREDTWFVSSCVSSVRCVFSLSRMWTPLLVSVVVCPRGVPFPGGLANEASRFGLLCLRVGGYIHGSQNIDLWSFLCFLRLVLGGSVALFLFLINVLGYIRERFFVVVSL